MTVLQAAEVFQNHLWEIDPNDQHADLTGRLLDWSPEKLATYLSNPEPEEQAHGPEEMEQMLAPISDPKEAAEIVLQWVQEKAEAISEAVRTDSYTRQRPEYQDE